MTAVTRLMVLVLALAMLGGCVTNSMLRERGYTAMNQGDWAAAESAFQQAVQRRPEDYVALYYLGLAKLRLDQPLEAQLLLERALTLTEQAPDDAQAGPVDLRERILDRLSEAYFAQEKFDRLTQFLGEIAETTHAPADYLRLARYQEQIGDLDGASVAYRKAALFAGSDPKPYIAVADFYRSINDPANEKIALRYAYHVDPTNPNVNRRLRELGIVPGPTAGLVPPGPERMP